MLAATDVQRYARQILVREVGKSGQERLLGSQVDVRGTSVAAEAAAELLSAAGVGVRRGPGVPEVAGRILGPTAYIDRRIACSACIAGFLANQPEPVEPERWAVAFGVGALAASDVMLGLLDPTRAPSAACLSPEPTAVWLECQCSR